LDCHNIPFSLTIHTLGLGSMAAVDINPLPELVGRALHILYSPPVVYVVAPTENHHFLCAIFSMFVYLGHRKKCNACIEQPL